MNGSSIKTYIAAKVPLAIEPCNPSPCGPNAQCNNGICTCLPEYQGDPYIGCRPECVLNSDCPRDKACIRNKCIDPCPGTCGQNADCNVNNHIPMCSCPQGFSGNAFILCSQIRGCNFSKKVMYKNYIFLNFSTHWNTFLFPIPLWTKQPMQRNKWSSCMFLCARLYWKSPYLSAWMYC